MDGSDKDQFVCSNLFDGTSKLYLFWDSKEKMLVVTHINSEETNNSSIFLKFITWLKKLIAKS